VRVGDDDRLPVDDYLARRVLHGGRQPEAALAQGFDDFATGRDSLVQVDRAAVAHFL